MGAKSVGEGGWPPHTLLPLAHISIDAVLKLCRRVDEIKMKAGFKDVLGPSKCSHGSQQEHVHRVVAGIILS